MRIFVPSLAALLVAPAVIAASQSASTPSSAPLQDAAAPQAAPPAKPITQKEQEAAGTILFRDKGCAYCHGKSTEGTHKGPSLVDVRKRLKPEQIANQIKEGGQKMPAFKESLSDDEVANLVAWLRAKHRPTAPPEPSSAP